VAAAQRIYARALFRAAQEQGRAEAIGRELSEFAGAVREIPELGELRALLKSRPLREKVREVEEAGAYVERVAAALKDREAEHEQRRAFLRQLPAARKELAELAELLG